MAARRGGNIALPTQLPLDRMQTVWKSQLDPLLANPINSAHILKSISLAAGVNNINHLLGAPLQGWTITRMRGVFAQVFDTQDSNPTPQLTLQLNASVPVIVDIEVF